VATAHQKLAVAIVLLALAGTLWSGYVAYKAIASSWLRGVTRVMIAMLGAQAVLGVVIALQGSRPQDPLHFVFGPAAILALPAATGIGRGRRPRTAAIIVAFGWVVTLSFGLRAVGTAGGLR